MRDPDGATEIIQEAEKNKNKKWNIYFVKPSSWSDDVCAYIYYLDKKNKIKELERLSNKLDKKILPHIEDIRRHDLPEIGDRRSFSLNAFMYGCCLRTTDGKGLFEWEEILDEFK